MFCPCFEWKLTTVDPQERSTCRLGVRSSYVERGLLMWMMPMHLQVNQKSDYYDDNFVMHYLVSFLVLQSFQHILT